MNKQMMNKQEEIRKIIYTYKSEGCLYPNKTCDFVDLMCDSGEGAYKCLMKRLSELGVVIKLYGTGATWGPLIEEDEAQGL